MTRLFRSYPPKRSVTPAFQTQKRHTTTLNRHAGLRTWHPSRSQFAGAPCTFTRLLPIDSKDGQRWLTNPSTNRRFGDGPYEKRALHGLRHGKNALPHPLCCPFFQPVSRNREGWNRSNSGRVSSDWGQNAAQLPGSGTSRPKIEWTNLRNRRKALRRRDHPKKSRLRRRRRRHEEWKPRVAEVSARGNFRCSRPGWSQPRWRFSARFVRSVGDADATPAPRQPKPGTALVLPLSRAPKVSACGKLRTTVLIMAAPPWPRAIRAMASAARTRVENNPLQAA